MPGSNRTIDILRHLASRPGHDEVKADFRQLLIEEFEVELSALDFERRVPEIRGRLDALIGRTIFEAKSDLVKEWADVVRRMPDYLADRERDEGSKFVGIASDGLRWAVFELANSTLVKIKETTLNPEDPDTFLAWFDGAVALRSELAPDPLTIRLELGQESVAYHRAFSEISRLWTRLRDAPAVLLKRQLWGQLLKLVYGREVESDDLWFQHTFLVVVAKCIAVSVLDLREDDPRRLLSGHAFENAGILGAVESDFFDWIVAEAEGQNLVRQIMAHVRRFRLREVESDVLKVLYESLIDRDERHGLGEYYTPDWLAEKVARNAIGRPLEQRVLDPACGSGTFLFQAIRLFLKEAKEADMPPTNWAREAAARVAGMDIHPVAVIIARVTYLLALAPALSSRAGAVSIPVYLGDALQLSITDVMGLRELSVRVPPAPGSNEAAKLDFPELFCRDPELFDKAIDVLRIGSEASLNRNQVEARILREVELRYKREPNQAERDAASDLGSTYTIFDALAKAGRDTVWAYVARNLSRPLAFSASGGWAEIVIGNPPWVAYRHMSQDLQLKFKSLSRSERLIVGRAPSQDDLCALFTVRAASLYLRPGGRIAFVLPLAALSRAQFQRLRTGSFDTVRIAWDEAWTMDETVRPLFPVPSCVLFGRRRAVSSPTPDVVRSYTGVLPSRDAPETIADQYLVVTNQVSAPAHAVSSGGSVYRNSFRNGATLFPRLLCFVERQAVGRLGGDQSTPLVRSRRSNQEKAPWKDQASIEKRVEIEFIKPILLGESIVPYGITKKFEGVIPISDDGRLLSASEAANLGVGGLHGWMQEAEKTWDDNKKSKLQLTEMFNYFNQLSSQYPTPELRVVYSKAGSQPAAAIVRDAKSVIENTLYWMKPASEGEAYYLVAILNSEAARSQAAKFQSRGQFGARHFDKVLFNLPIVRYDENIKLHRVISYAGRVAEKRVAKLEIPAGLGFKRARSFVRSNLKTTRVATRIDALVSRLLM